MTWVVVFLLGLLLGFLLGGGLGLVGVSQTKRVAHAAQADLVDWVVDTLDDTIADTQLLREVRNRLERR